MTSANILQSFRGKKHRALHDNNCGVYVKGLISWKLLTLLPPNIQLVQPVWNRERNYKSLLFQTKLPVVQAGFRKGRGTRDQIVNIRWIIKKARGFQKKHISASLTMPKPLTVWITINCGKFFKRWEYQTTWPAS